MLYIFNTNRERKDYGATAKRQCDNCRNLALFHLVLTRDWFCLFFIELFVYSDVWSLECPVCQHGQKLRGRELEEAKDLNRASRRKGQTERVIAAH